MRSRRREEDGINENRMFKVECPGCKASYNVDERRVPDTGLKMRCPKCATTFNVRRPGAEEADLPAVPGAKPAPPPAAPKPAAPTAAKPGAGAVTQQDLPAARAAKGDLPAPLANEPSEPDLPTVRGGPAGAKSADVDLPAARREADLPAAKASAPKPPAAAGKPAAPRIAAPKGIDIPLPSPRIETKPLGPSDGEADLPTIPGRPLTAVADLPAKKAPAAPARKGTVIGLGTTEPPEEEDLLPAVRPDAKRPAAVTPPRPPADLPTTGRNVTRPVPNASRAVTAPAPPELDLPLAMGPAISSTPLNPRQVTGGVLFGDELEMNAELPAARGPVVDLPSPRGGGADLPSPRGADLPSPRVGAAELPSVRAKGADAKRGGADLPAARDPAADLPSPRARNADLPAPAAAALPARAKNDFGELDLPLAATGPALPALGAALPIAKGSQPPAPLDFDDFEAPLAPPPPRGRPLSSAPPPPFESAPPPAQAAPPAAAKIERQAGGGVEFGEVDLDIAGHGPSASPTTASAPPPPGDVGWGERDLGGAPADDMDFGELPNERTSAPAAAPQQARAPSVPPASAEMPAVRPSRPRPQEPTAPTAPKNRGLKIAAGVLGIALVAGGSLAFTKHGAFGYNTIYDALKASDYDALLASTQKTVRAELAKDTADADARALAAVQRAHESLPRAQGVSALGAYIGFLRELRFGHDAASHARAKSLYSDIAPDASGTVFELARAAQLAGSEQLARANQAVDGVVRRAPNDPDALGLAGEIALAAKDAPKALASWTKLASIDPSPRALYGVARAEAAKGDVDAAEKTAQKVLAASPSHPGALLLLATATWERTHDDAATNAYLDRVLKDGRAAASTGELVRAYTLKGQIDLRRSRVSAAEASFNEALKLDPKSGGALAGVGEALYRAGRHAEALARFTSAMEAEPEAIEPKIGVAKTKIALERLSEAKDLLKGLAKKLKDANKADFHVVAWLGRAEESMGDKAAAEADYNEAIKLGGTNTDVVDAYVWLAQLLIGQGRTAEAQKLLDEAKGKLPKSVAVYKALGDIAFQAGRYEDAEGDFHAALKLDDTDIATRFKLGVTERRMGKFDAATEAFDKVAETDKEFPGLSLERAVLFEAAGQSQKALELYQAALAKAPDDADLMLRVGAALLGGGTAQIAKSEELLRKVLSMRPTSAEANHFLGRALLVKGTNLSEALKFLTRATEIDPNRAEYWLYVGWAANDADQQQKAAQALDHALDLDKGLADAYWQRGVLRRRQRAVVDAEKDLLKALELRPSRYEAYATLAEVYEDQQKWPQALQAWQKAIAADGNRATWRFRLGKLMTQNGNKAAAYEHLAKAVELGAQLGTAPPWLGEASLLLADAERAAGKKEAAIEHYQRFLALASPESPYVKDACTALKSLGAECKPLRLPRDARALDSVESSA